MKKINDLSGQVFSQLTVLSFSHLDSTHHAVFNCQCSCGNVCKKAGYSLKKGKTKSCGCLYKTFKRKGPITHNLRRHELYPTWLNIRQRCNNKKARDYIHYGARGISICERWSKFNLFLQDMGERPSPKHTIERVENNGNYEPDNCIWLINTEQQKNRRELSSSILVTCQGITQNLKKWAQHIGINYTTLHYRYNAGWSMNEIISVGKTLHRHKR